ncbi:MAG: phosphate ABC transporter permease PstA [Myxococcales bacterium]|nr:phosphate ABC transporter permease PstA [Myxococcales bacterium]
MRTAERPRWRGLAAAGVVHGAALAVLGAFAWILGDLLVAGLGQVDWAFLTAPPQDAGRAGGVGPILASTGILLAICLVVAVPLGLGAAIFLAEFTPAEGRLGRLVRRSLDVLAGVPSIVFGLFGNVLFCKTLGLGFSLLSGGLTLACMALPLIIRTAEASLRAVPPGLRQSAVALGMSRTSVVRHLLLPAAAPGLLAGFVLGVGRALAETAALIFTSGYVDRLPESILDSGRALSVHIYDLSMNVPGGDHRAAASALVLVVALLAINGASALAMGRFGRRLGAR